MSVIHTLKLWKNGIGAANWKIDSVRKFLKKTFWKIERDSKEQIKTLKYPLLMKKLVRGREAST